MKQFRASKAYKGVKAIEDEKISIRKRELQIRAKQFITRLASKITILDCDSLEQYFTKVISNTLHDDDFLKKELIDDSEKYIKLLHEK